MKGYVVLVGVGASLMVLSMALGSISVQEERRTVVFCGTGGSYRLCPFTSYDSVNPYARLGFAMFIAGLSALAVGLAFYFLQPPRGAPGAAPVPTLRKGK